MLIDSHAHLDFIDDLEGVFKRAKAAGVGQIITIGTSLEASKKSIKIAEKYSSADLQIYATCGIHPQDGKDEVKKLGSKYLDELQTLSASNKVFAIGECGLDYYLGGEKRLLTVDKDKEFQRKLFEEQINLSIKQNLPVVIHCRNAWDDIFSLLTTYYGLRTRLKGVFHCWTGNWQAAKKALDLGFYISFSGIVTYKNAEEVAEVAQKAPLERILLETDSPFLAPEPLRDKQNEPKNVKITAQFLASLRNEPFKEIAKVTSENAKRLFKLES